MKILRLKLVNYIGIKKGLDLNELELNIPDNDIPFIMLIGKNGSGKSTILSQMHPFKDSFDDRKDLIIPDTIGIKEFDFEVDGTIYKVKHVFDKKTSSFISVNDEELNPNGGVRTFEDILYQRLGLTKEYMKIGKIGSNIGNFVQSTASERKDLIASFVSEVDKYVEAFEKVSEKFRLDNEKLKIVAKELNSFNEEKLIEAELESNKKELSDVEELIVENSQQIAVLQHQVDLAKEALEKIDYIKVKDDINYYETQKNNAETTRDNIHSMNINSEFNEDLKRIDELKEQLQKDNIEKIVLDNAINNLKNNLVELSNNKVKTEYKINGFGIANLSLDDLSTETDNLKAKIESVEKEIAENPLKEFLTNIDTVPYELQCYNNFMTYVLQNYSQLNGDSLLPNLTNIEMFFKKDCPDIIKSAILQSKEALQSRMTTKLNLEREHATKNASLGKLDILQKRPKACSIDSCPFISDALQYKNLPKELSKLEEEIRNLETNIESMNKKAEQINDIKDLFKTTVTQYKLLGAQGNPIYRYQSSIYGTISKFLKQPINIIKEAYEYIKSLTEKYLSDVVTLNSLKEQYNKNLESINTIKTSKDVLNVYMSELNNIKENINKVTIEITSKTDQATALSKEISKKSAYINDLEEYIRQENILNASAKYIEEYTRLKEKYETLNADFQKKTMESKNNLQLINMMKTKKEELNHAITQGEITLARIHDLSKKRKELEKSYAKLKLIKDALDPKSGIPLIFIKSYLGKTELIANELLRIAFNGKFEIHFHSSAKEFFIQVSADGEPIEDIKLASQGEVALTTISISLALIEQYSGQFNILSLDEMDGALDESNREAFISILDSQIRKLGIDQVFIISHNNAFDNVPMNIIALPGSENKISNQEFMQNKTVIFNAC